jgi:hypothetical protein
MHEEFDFTDAGYRSAFEWLSQIGEVAKDTHKYQTMDRIQLIVEANNIKARQVILNG